MASKSISFSQVFLAMVVILSATHAKASASTHPFCMKCNPGVEKAQCESMVKGAKTWDEALTNVINTILKELEQAKPIIDNLPSKLPANLLPQSKDSLDSTCKEVFESIDDDLHKALDQIKNGDPQNSIPSELSAVSSFLSDCSDGLQEFGVEIPELTTIGDVVQKYASISLAVTQLKYHYT